MARPLVAATCPNVIEYCTPNRTNRWSRQHMKTNYVLVDYENVQPKDLALVKDGPFRVKVFLGPNRRRPGSGANGLRHRQAQIVRGRRDCADPSHVVSRRRLYVEDHVRRLAGDRVGRQGFGKTIRIGGRHCAHREFKRRPAALFALPAARAAHAPAAPGA